MTEVERLRKALRTLQEIGEQGMPQTYGEWLTSHDHIARIAREALAATDHDEFNPDWDRLEACHESLREHRAEIERLRAEIEKRDALLRESLDRVGPVNPDSSPGGKAFVDRVNALLSTPPEGSAGEAFAFAILSSRHWQDVTVSSVPFKRLEITLSLERFYEVQKALAERGEG